MLKKLIVNNYKSLVGFHCEFDHINLILGPNGSGKSAVFDVLSGLKAFVTGRSPVSVFGSPSLTKWEAKTLQTFALHIDGNGGIYEYVLSVAHDVSRDMQWVQSETVNFNSRNLYRADEEHAIFTQEDGPEDGLVFGGISSLSGLALPIVDESSDYTKLAWIKEWFKNKLHCYRLDPTFCPEFSMYMHRRGMAGMWSKEETELDQTGANFVGWLRHLRLAKPDVTDELTHALRGIHGEQFSFKLEQEGGTVRHLFVNLGVEKRNDKPVNIKLGFEDLSDGERALFVLYALLHLARDPDVTLFFDEPDNYVALQEIQPWLIALKDATEEVGSQALLISHHPEMVDYLAPDCGLLFDREGNGPTRVRDFPKEAPDEPLRASELIIQDLL